MGLSLPLAISKITNSPKLLVWALPVIHRESGYEQGAVPSTYFTNLFQNGIDLIIS